MKEQKPDRDFEMLLSMLCHPRNAHLFQGDPNILTIAHGALRRFRKNYPDHSSFFDECDPQVPEIQKNNSDGDGISRLFDKYREHLESVVQSGSLLCVDEEKPVVSFAEAMQGATKVVKKLSAALGGEKNPCGEIPLTPRCECNERTVCGCPKCKPDEWLFVESENDWFHKQYLAHKKAQLADRMAQRAERQISEEIHQIHGSFKHPDGTLRSTPPACELSDEEVAAAREANDDFNFKLSEWCKLPKGKEAPKSILKSYDPLTTFLSDDAWKTILKLKEQESENSPNACLDCNVVDTVFLPERKIGAWARGECVCNYIKSRSHYTREHNFTGSREDFNEFPPRENFLTKEEAKKMWDEAGRFVANPAKHQTERNDPICRRCDSITGRMIQSQAMYLQWLNGDCICDQLQPLDKEELETESRCDCGGPPNHVPNGPNCRKPM